MVRAQGLGTEKSRFETPVGTILLKLLSHPSCPSEVDKWLVSRNLGDGGLNAPGKHQIDSYQNPSVG